MKVKKSLLKFISKDLDSKSRLQFAKREAAEFQALSTGDQVTALVVLSYDKDSDISMAAYETLDGSKVEFILSALEERLHHLVLRELFVHFKDKTPVLSAIISNTGIDNSLAYTIVREGPIEVFKTLDANPALINKFPSIINGLRENPLASESLAERLETAAKEAEPTTYEEEEEPTSEETAADVLSSGEEFDSDRFNVYQTSCSMTAGEKIKLAHTGDRSVRNLLIKDKNRVVALSVLKNPKLTEQEVIAASSSTNTSEEILRDISNSRDWMKSYNVKLAMAFNPRTPLSSSLKLIDYIHERDLKIMAKNKGIPGVLKSAAERKLKLKSGH